MHSFALAIYIVVAALPVFDCAILVSTNFADTNFGSCGAIPPQAVAAARPRRRQLLSCSLGSTSRRAHPAPAVFLFVRVLLIANNRVCGFYSYVWTAERSRHRRPVYWCIYDILIASTISRLTIDMTCILMQWFCLCVASSNVLVATTPLGLW